MRPVNRVLRMDKETYTVPRRVQDAIPIKRIWEDGIFQTGTRYSKQFKFTDTNYRVSSDSMKRKILGEYASILSTLDPSATTKITINNRRFNQKSFEDSVLLSMKGDGLDMYRKEYNAVIMDKAKSGNGIIQEKYITVSVCKKNVKEARAYFNRVKADLGSAFGKIGIRLTELNATERLRILHDFYRVGEEEYFRFDLKEMMQKGHDFRDYICPDTIKRYDDYIMLGDKYARVLFLKEYSSSIYDDTIMEMVDRNLTMMVSVDVVPVPMDEAVREVEQKMMGSETNITNWQRRQNANNNFSAAIPYDMQQQRLEMREYMDDLTVRDKKLMMTVMTVVHIADSKEQLDQDTETLKTAAAGRFCQLGVLRYQQMKGMNTALPIGIRKVDVFRTMTTESLSYLVPFNVQEVQEDGGIFFGVNAISGNLVLCNPANLINQSMVVLGKPGSGKSFMIKLLILFLMLGTDDQIIIMDPEGEYTPLVKALGGSVIRCAVGGTDHLNAMDMAQGYGDGNGVALKAEYIMSLLDLMHKGGIGPHHKSIIDRCVMQVFRDSYQTGEIPTLGTLREVLLNQIEPEAHELALTLEMYTKGTQNIFGQKTNVDMNNRLLSFDIHDLGSQMKNAGFLTITDAILNRVNYNWSNQRHTHIFVDEFHVAFENEYGGNFFTSAWRQFRKRNASPCAITQNITYMLDSKQANTIVSNSEFVIMLSQSDKDLAALFNLLKISEELANYVHEVPPGNGLIKYGANMIPFVNEFPNNTELYNLITTKPGEGAFSESQVDFYAYFQE